MTQTHHSSGWSFGVSASPLMVSRRGCLRIGATALGGLTMPGALGAGAIPGGRHKSFIHIVLRGGPSQFETFDPKPEAPSDIRGEFGAIDTVVPGIRISEQFPMLAKAADKFSLVRSVVCDDGTHGSYEISHGVSLAQRRSVPGGVPGLGPLQAKLLGQVHSDMPPFICLSGKKESGVTTPNNGYNEPGSPGCLGPAFSAFDPSIAPQDQVAGPGGKAQAAAMRLHADIAPERFRDRQQLLRAIDGIRRDIDRSGAVEAADTFTQQAFDILSSGRLINALDLTREDPRIRERYGKPLPLRQKNFLPNPYLSYTNPEYMLLARRLVEAGARNVTFAFGWWDWHSNYSEESRWYAPPLDQALSALLEDLTDRGLIDDVAVLVWGEMGRGKIGPDAMAGQGGGRDHWPKVRTALVAGGGMKAGRVVGATNHHGLEVADRPVHVQDMFATIYKTLGVDVQTTTYTDLAGRPRFLVDHTKYGVVSELF